MVSFSFGLDPLVTFVNFVFVQAKKHVNSWKNKVPSFFQGNPCAKDLVNNLKNTAFWAVVCLKFNSKQGRKVNTPLR